MDDFGNVFYLLFALLLNEYIFETSIIFPIRIINLKINKAKKQYLITIIIS